MLLPLGQEVVVHPPHQRQRVVLERERGPVEQLGHHQPLVDPTHLAHLAVIKDSVGLGHHGLQGSPRDLLGADEERDDLGDEGGVGQAGPGLQGGGGHGGEGLGDVKAAVGSIA